MKNKIWYYLLIVVFALISGCQKEGKFIFMGSPWISYGSMTDKDGNIYKTILIGTQTWMVENLKTTKYNDGTSIPFVSEPTSWSNLSTPACCWQQNDPARKVTYGVLYNWYTINTGKLCPKTWHVPSDSEWTALTDYLGGENVAGGKLKESGFKHWYSPNTGATNEVAFSAFQEVNVLTALMRYLRTSVKMVAGGLQPTRETWWPPTVLCLTAVTMFRSYFSRRIPACLYVVFGIIRLPDFYRI